MTCATPAVAFSVGILDPARATAFALEGRRARRSTARCDVQRMDDKCKCYSFDARARPRGVPSVVARATGHG